VAGDEEGERSGNRASHLGDDRSNEFPLTAPVPDVEAEGERFELSIRLTTDNGFRDSSGTCEERLDPADDG
jgi:hypothetical protein